MRNRWTIGVLAAIHLEGIAMANQVSVPMLTATDIQASVAPEIFQGVSETSVGAIFFPETILTVLIDRLEGEGEKIIQQWSKSHAFVLVPFSIGIRPAEDRIPERVEFTAAFSGLGELGRQPIVIDTFPETGFKPSAFKGSAELKVNAEGKFEPLPIGTRASAGANVDASLSYTYSPAYANVVSGFASAHAFWQFSRTQSDYPIGEIPVKLLLAVPKSFSEATMTVDFDVKARFSGDWWSGGQVVAAYSSLLLLPRK